MVLLGACQSKSEKADDVSGTVQNKVEGLHDQLMKPYMEFDDLKEKIRQQIAANPGLRVQGDSVLGMLNVAGANMDAWMMNYSADTLKHLDATAGKNYMENQMNDMLKLREQIETAHTKAHAFLGTPADHQ